MQRIANPRPEQGLVGSNPTASAMTKREDWQYFLIPLVATGCYQFVVIASFLVSHFTETGDGCDSIMTPWSQSYLDLPCYFFDTLRKDIQIKS